MVLEHFRFKESELNEFISYIDNPPVMTDEIRQIIEKDLRDLSGDFCRGCGYCLPCPAEIDIKDSARMSLLIRRSPSKRFLTQEWQEKMKRIEKCKNCGMCKSRCPYQLNTPELLKKNYEDYKNILAGKVFVE